MSCLNGQWQVVHCDPLIDAGPLVSVDTAVKRGSVGSEGTGGRTGTSLL
jgi:hypothetical protein